MGIEQRQRQLAQRREPLARRAPAAAPRGRPGAPGRDRAPDLLAPADERHLAARAASRSETGPVRRAAAIVCEGEAAAGDEAAAGRSSRRLRRRPARPGRASARRSARSEHARAPRAPRGAERGDRGALAVGLLEAHPRLAGAARAEHHGARVDAVARSRQLAAATRRRVAVRGARARAAARRGARCSRRRERPCSGERRNAPRPLRGGERGAQLRSPRDLATSRSRRCASSRSARRGAPAARTPRSSRRRR